MSGFDFIALLYAAGVLIFAALCLYAKGRTGMTTSSDVILIAAILWPVLALWLVFDLIEAKGRRDASKDTSA